MNENIQMGTSFEFVKQAIKIGKDNPKLIACPVGRQLAVRNLETDEVNIVPRDNAVDQITTLTSIVNNNDQRALFAIGETDYNNSNDLYIDIYDVQSNGVFQSSGYRKKIEVP